MAATPIWAMRPAANPGKRRVLRALAALGLGAVLLLADLGGVRADPPQWAPANGYRGWDDHDQHGGKHYKKHHRDDDDDDDDDHDDDDHDDDDDDNDYRYGAGNVNYARCTGTLVGGIAGAAAGGILGGAVVQGDRKAAAVLGGVILGAILGGVIGHAIDQADADCAGNVFVYGAPGRAVKWRSRDRNADYILVPVSDFRRAGRDCRSFVVKLLEGGKTRKKKGQACRGDDGFWYLDR